MDRTILTFSLLCSLMMPVSANDDNDRSIKLIQTTDVHGNFFPYNFIDRTPWSGSMARVASYVDSVRKSVGSENVVLLDNGDILQGQPSAYYYNFIDTVNPHIVDEIYGYLGYDAATIGNHDIETGHDVYDRWISDSPIPILGANVVDAITGEPYLTPYLVLERNGVKIAVLGLLTPAIPAWLPENLWSGLEFIDMETSARKWLPIIKEKESPDIIVGLFHSGHNSDTRTAGIKENASVAVAENVPGFDVIFMGHDHQRYMSKVANINGDSVLVINPANNANYLAVVDVDLKTSDNGVLKNINGHIEDIRNIEPSGKYIEHFAKNYSDIDSFVSKKIGVSRGNFSTRDAFFGPSAFMDLIHRLQLEITSADISFAAPLSFDSNIGEGDILMSDMFKLYKYENLLYTMELTGREIKDYLEMSYSLWTRRIDSADGHLINFLSEDPSPENNSLRYPSYNFDSAAGIVYTVDVTRPDGEKIEIKSMADGTPFELDKKYKVAVNSYRGNGGGDLMTRGAGIPQSELAGRVVFSTDKDLRYYLMKAIERKGEIAPEVLGTWRFVPEDIVAPAAARDKEILFSSRSSKEQK